MSARVVAAPAELGLARPVLAIGNFDGVHRGHAALLERMRELADAEGAPAGVITFFPPARVLFAGASYLSGPEEKLERLATYRPDAVAMVPFTREYARTDKDAFLAELAGLAPRAIVVGEDFRFGRDRAGGLDDLQHVPERLEVFQLKRDAAGVISSTRIRERLEAGDVDGAAALLGYRYFATGRVARGDARGRTIGFPTANLELPERKALPRGVFAVRVEVDGASHDGMANVGPRPSFPGEPPRLEAHLFDFGGDLYDRILTVRFVAYLRGQVRFASLDELRAQLARDRDDARARLAADTAGDGAAR